MELRRAADALLRAQALPFASFLSPAANARWMSNAQLGYRGCANRNSQRAFSSTVQRKAIRPSATTSATPPTNSKPTILESNPTKPQPSLEDTAKSLWASKPRTTGYGILSPEKERAMNGGTSASDLLATLNAKRSPSSSADISRMKIALAPGGLSTSQAIHDDVAAIPKAARKPILLNPSTGRSVTIGSTGIDVAKGFRLMEMSCARNKVKSDFMRQRFHERGGLKRKRLRRERWRVRFLDGFKATVLRVKQLKNQGW